MISMIFMFTEIQKYSHRIPL